MKLPTIADYAMKTARAKYVVTDDPRDVKLARLTAEVARLREALAPFAEFSRAQLGLGGLSPKTGTIYAVNGKRGEAEITVEHLRAAEFALEITDDR